MLLIGYPNCPSTSYTAFSPFFQHQRWFVLLSCPKPWHQVFTSFPISEFSSSSFSANNSDRSFEFCAFVYNSLLRQCRQYRSIPRFKLSVSADLCRSHRYSVQRPLPPQIDELIIRCIEQVTQKGVKELSICFRTPVYYRLPEAMLSVTELAVCLRKLRKVKVKGQFFSPIKKIEINAVSLHTFSYSACYYAKTDIDLASCKNLEVFKFKYCIITEDLVQHLNCNFPALKVLVLHGYIHDIQRNLKLNTYIEGMRKEGLALVDDLFCICRPESLSLESGCGSNDEFMEILCKKASGQSET
ncbi:hypothetical protein OIU85_007757 [Salix viminalis]|uniref:FBD domain-containing protein n=1 Tax=Salix viminalis TaxID=40686 RepID=A0A9Q0P9T3_SALVM|nr:hypothetical protein OIU85_007757 [Salix viminalis]